LPKPKDKNLGKQPAKNVKRGRPEMSATQKAEMRSRISATARDLFKAEGFSKVSMRRIAKEIDCTPMALYRYYNSKIDLLRSLWGEVLSELFDLLDGLPTNSSSSTRLLDLGTAYVGFWLDTPEYYRLVFMAEGVSQPDVSLFMDNPEIIAKYGIFIEAIQNANSLKLSDVELKLKSDFFLSTLPGIVHNHVTISGYLWSSPLDQIRLAVAAICKDG